VLGFTFIITADSKPLSMFVESSSRVLGIGGGVRPITYGPRNFGAILSMFPVLQFLMMTSLILSRPIEPSDGDQGVSQIHVSDDIIYVSCCCDF
jgi:hypothetical protein